MKKTLNLVLLCILPLLSAFSQGGERAYYQLKFYRFENPAQMQRLDQFFEHAYLPALHRAGIDQVGVFKPIEGKNEEKNFVIVFLPFGSLAEFEDLSATLQKDEVFQQAGRDYLDAAHDNPPYTRIESILLRAFSGFPQTGEPVQEGIKKNRVYELRSYQASTERLYERKVEMFDDGESDIFVNLGFHPLFFGEGLSSSYMPHLMYMVTCKDEASHAALWNAFREHPDWLAIKDLERYKNTVSHITSYLLYPADYSDF